MFAPARTSNAVLRPIHVADALIGLALPMASLSLVGLRLLLVLPDSIAPAVFSPPVLLSAMSTNLANLLLSLWALRGRRGPIWFCGLLGIGEVLSGIYFATLVDLFGVFSHFRGLPLAQQVT